MSRRLLPRIGARPRSIRPPRISGRNWQVCTPVPISLKRLLRRLRLHWTKTRRTRRHIVFLVWYTRLVPVAVAAVRKMLRVVVLQVGRALGVRVVGPERLDAPAARVVRQHLGVGSHAHRRKGRHGVLVHRDGEGLDHRVGVVGQHE